MAVKRFTVAATTNGSGAATVYTSRDVNGRIHSIQLVRDGTDPLANTADITITGEDTGLAILALTGVSADFTRAPRMATHDTSGVASLYAAAGEPVEDHLVVSGERVKIVIATGGASKKGTFYVTVLT
jgi:hypothetical protein